MLPRKRDFIGDLRDSGLRGIEVFHSDHRPADMERYAGIASKLQSVRCRAARISRAR